MKTTRRLTAVTLVLLLLLSLCGCMTEEPTPSGQGGTTAVPTQVTTTASSASATTATDAQPTTAETTAVTTVETTKVPTTAATTTTATTTVAPTTTVPPVKPLVEWTVIEEKAKEGPLPGTAIDFIKIKTFRSEYINDFTENKLRDKECVIIENKQQFDALFTNVYDPEYIPGMSAQLDYTQSFFEDNALIVLERVSSDTNCGGYWITGISVDNGTLHANIMEMEIGNVGGAALTAFYVLIEVSRADMQVVDTIHVYHDLMTFSEFDDWKAWYKEHADRVY